MSSNLAPFSWFDVDVVKKRLFNEKNTDSAEIHSLRIKDVENLSSLNRLDANSAWLQDCLIGISPSREILVFCNSSTAVIMTPKWESKTNNTVSSKYVLLWSGSLIHDRTECITSVLCLPLEFVGRSSQHSVDWTCVVVGFTTGHVRFYTENGSLMISELFHHEPVLNLKCHSYRPVNSPGETEYREELIISYQSAVVYMDGFTLFQTLRGCRSHLAKVKANCGEPMKAPPLIYKKWGFADHNEVGISDCEFVGSRTVHQFDHFHLNHLALCSGVGQSEFQMSNDSLVIATGNYPFVGFYYPTQEGISKILDRAFTGMVKETLSNTVSSWIFGGKPTEEKVTVTALEPGHPMNRRFYLCETNFSPRQTRRGENIVMTPNRRLSAVTDNLGRIVVIDNFKGMAVRLWKGYRDAHCGWLEVLEDPIVSHGKLNLTSSKKGVTKFDHPTRMAHFLIVHCLRSSILQIISVQKGSKIATIPVPKGSRLLYVKHGVIGTENVISKKKRNCMESTCVLIEPSGLMNEVNVPFHSSLSEESNEKIRDYHLIHRIKKALKNSRAKEIGANDENKEVCNLIEELRCPESQMLVLITMATYNHITAPIFIQAIKVILLKLENREDKLKNINLWRMCQKLLQLLNLYSEALTSFQSWSNGEYKKGNGEEMCKEEEFIKFMVEKLKMSDSEVKDFLMLANIFRTTYEGKGKHPPAGFENNLSLALIDFLSCFDLTSNEEDEYLFIEPVMISLKEAMEEKTMGSISYFLFYKFLFDQEPLNEWTKKIKDSGIITKDLLSMAMHTWIIFGKHFMENISVVMVQRLLSMIRAVCQIRVSDKICDEECINVLPSWKEVRWQLFKSKSPFLALVGALTCRVLLDTDTCNNDSLRKTKEDEWEHISEEGMAWDKIVRNLMDLSFLEAALSWSVDSSSFDVSLASVTSNGKGYISEVVAQWVLLCSSHSKHWSPSSLVSFLLMLPGEDLSLEKKNSALEALDCLRLLRKRFPSSISTSTLIANVCWESARRITFASYSDVPILTSTLDWLEAIPSPSIRRGLCVLLWTVHLHHRIKAASQLLECYPNMAALPEKVVIDEIGLPSMFVLSDLFGCAYKFLDIMTGLADCKENKEELEEEDHLMAGNRDGCPPSLLELALLQPSMPSVLHPPVFTLCHQLCIVLCLISRIHYKGPTSISQPISQLFTPEEQSVLLSDGELLYRKEKAYLNSPILTARLSFFKRSITAVCRSEDYGGKLSQELIGLIYKGAEMFGLSIDHLQRYHICELYSCGYDRQAEELLPAVVDKENLASQLLVIAFQRIKYYVAQCGQGNKRSEVMATFSPAALARFNCQPSYLVSKDMTIKSTEQLLGIILAHLDEDSKLYSEAMGVLDAVSVLASHENDVSLLE